MLTDRIKTKREELSAVITGIIGSVPNAFAYEGSSE
jgi:hypothetical protein